MKPAAISFQGKSPAVPILTTTPKKDITTSPTIILRIKSKILTPLLPRSYAQITIPAVIRKDKTTTTFPPVLLREGRRF